MCIYRWVKSGTLVGGKLVELVVRRDALGVGCEGIRVDEGLMWGFEVQRLFPVIREKWLDGYAWMGIVQVGSYDR